MRIAFVGKGGSGKTTTAALVSAFARDHFKRVILVDADINVHLSDAIGASKHHLFKDVYKDFELQIRGARPELQELASLPRTLPPLNNESMVKPSDPNGIYAKYLEDGVAVLNLGTYNADSIGWSCHHNNLGYLELVLNHTYDSKEDLILVDLTAGTDVFGVGLLSLFDAVFVVVEPTKKSIETFRQIEDLSKQENVQLFVVANKIIDESDLTYMRSAMSTPIDYTIELSNYVRRLERDEKVGIEDIEVSISDEVKKLLSDVQSRDTDWARFQDAVIYNHKRVIEKWPKNKFKIDLTSLLPEELDLAGMEK